MKLEEMDITTLWAELAIAELVRSGVTTYIISPGSRSTPLALAVARNERAEIITHFDERGAGFVAVGYARGAHKPAALICTSGTAVANYLPAVVEASMDHLPMIVLSADRPPELHDTGANQTINQRGIFGSFVRWEQTIPCPTESIRPDFVLTTIDQAVFRSTGSNAGPVHLNFQFREPLIPDVTKTAMAEYVAGLAPWRGQEQPLTTYSHSAATTSEAEISDIAKLVSNARLGLMVVGRLKQTVDEQRNMVALSERLGWPVVTDIGSGLRLGHGVAGHLPHFDLTLLGGIADLRYDCILHLGGPLVSKRITEFIGAQTGPYMVVHDSPERQDCGNPVTVRVVANVSMFAKTLRSILAGQRHETKATPAALRNREVDRILRDVLDSAPLTEPLIPRVITRQIDKTHALFLASSLTVRDFDMYAPCDGAQVPVGCNRGASGIDGTVASAVGFARGLNKPTTLVIGDTALLHDLNSVALLKDTHTPPVTIVVINNGGGAIFSLLPVAELGTDAASDGTFEKIFLQEHTFVFKAAAEMFGLQYANPRETTEFRGAYEQFINSGKPGLIELQFDWRESRRARLDLRDKIKTVLSRG